MTSPDAPADNVAFLLLPDPKEEVPTGHIAEQDTVQSEIDALNRKWVSGGSRQLYDLIQYAASIVKPSRQLTFFTQTTGP